MLLHNMQTDLAALYEAPVEHVVTDFLITDARLARELEPDGPERSNTERLLLRESDDGLDISLFIDGRVLATLHRNDPYTCLDAANLNDFLVALEGISHFNYVIWNALRGRPVSQLELELQAEVDKYVTALARLDEQGEATDAAAVHDTLFDAVKFDDKVDEVSAQRYRAANHYAGKYCRKLSRRYPAHHRMSMFLNELRRFYRLPQNRKIDYIERLN